MTILMKLFEKIACLNILPTNFKLHRCAALLMLKCEESKPTFPPPPSKLSPGGAVDCPIRRLWSG